MVRIPWSNSRAACVASCVWVPLPRQTALASDRPRPDDGGDFTRPGDSSPIAGIAPGASRATLTGRPIAHILAVKLSAIALDYDGTIARGDALDPSVRESIGAARRRGIIVVLVTGRILGELRRVAGDLHFVDAVVAENGAVVHFPNNGRTTLLAPPISESFVDEVRRQGVHCASGQCLVDADANDAPRLLAVIRALEQPLVLAFNRSRVMVLPQGVSKATGLAVALNTLRLSPRNTLAIGDAENDYEMLRLAEIGVAVEWGSAALRAAGDVVLRGDGPAAVAKYIHTLAAKADLPAVSRARRRLLLGFTESGREFALAVRGRNVLITGDTKSGKSWVAGLLCEQLILHGYCVCVIDPEGDYTSLEALPGVTVLGGEDPPPTPRELLRALRYPDRSVVLDLSRLLHDEKMEYVRALLPALNVLRRRTGLPHRILLDEAHYFLHDDDTEQLLDLDRNGYTVVTYAASQLPKALLSATEVMIVTCESNPAELLALRTLCERRGEPPDNQWASIAHLRVGQAVALPMTEESQGRLQLFSIATRLTPHVRHRQKYVDVPVGLHRGFVFPAGAEGGECRRAQTLRQFVMELELLPAAALGGYLQRGDFSRWIGKVFGDHALAAELHVLEGGYRAGHGANTQLELVDAIRARYDLVDEAKAVP
jgi:hydroxymethylpyrimidine pyrophosphatase-like HAD family hydrolase